jgi:hypothetical protein
MNEALRNLVAEYAAQSVPWVRFCMVLVPVVALGAFEYKMLQKGKEVNLIESRVLSGMVQANGREQEYLARILKRVEGLEKEADSVLEGILNAEQAGPDLKAWERLGPPDSVTKQSEDILSVKLTGGELEYHAFVSALNDQEATTPLMRCTSLSLKTTGKPFHTSALPLQVDLELAFPRAPFHSSFSEPKPTEK